MKSARRAVVSSLSFERLEDRMALAGNVLVELSGATGLKITGDAQENDISITVVGGPAWRITGNITFDGPTTVQFGKNGQPGAFQDVPVPAGLFGNVTIDMKTATTTDPARVQVGGADLVKMEGLHMLGDLTIKGGNAGVVDVDDVVARAKVNIDFDAKNGLSEVNGNEAVGCKITITDSFLGFPLNTNAAGKNVTISTKDCADFVALGTVAIGKNLTIKTKGSTDSVGLLETTVNGNLSIDAGHAEKGPAPDVVAAAELFVGGTTKIKTGKGQDVVLIGSVPPLSPNTLTKTVAVDTGADADIVFAQGTTFGGDVKVTTKDGDDTVGVSPDNSLNHPRGPLFALRSTKGGKGTDTLLNGFGIGAPINEFELFQGDLNALAAQVFLIVEDRFGDFLADRGIVLP